LYINYNKALHETVNLSIGTIELRLMLIELL